MAPVQSITCNNMQDEQEDRISSLPEGILRQILSLLSTESAVCTSVLSIQWKYLWTGISTLKFLGYDWKDQKNFLKFVDRVLLLHDTKRINKFYLFSETHFNASRINSLISFLTSHNIGDMTLFVQVENPLVLPGTLLNCESFSITCFEPGSFCTFDASISRIHLSRLKFLKLFNIAVSCDQELQQLTFDLPVLEELIFGHGPFVNVKEIIFFVPALKKLDHRVNMYGVVSKDRVEFKYYADSLRSLHACVDKSHDIYLHNITLLSEVYVHSFSTNAVFADTFLQSISTVVNLTVIDWALLKLSELDLFPNLLSLLKLKTLTVVTGKDVVLTDTLLTKFMCCLPINVETLIFKNGLHVEDFDEEESYSWTPRTILKPILVRLKSVELVRIYRNEKELGLVNFLLKNARELENINISFSEYLEPGVELPFSAQVQELSGVSTQCVIKLL